MKFLVKIIAALVLSTGVGLAKCPAKAPSTKSIDFISGDQQVNAAWLKTNLSGRKVHFKIGGVENYVSDGSYFFKLPDGRTSRAPNYKFYKNGYRCINYPNGPRVDFYVVNDGKLYMIAGNGARFAVRVTK